jgi:tight adherence protein B
MDELWLIYGLAFGSAVLAVEALYWTVFARRGVKKAINRRLALGAKHASQTEVFDLLRNERGVADFGSGALAGFNDFLVQTGLKLSMPALVIWVLVVGGLLSAAATPFISPHALGPVVGFALAPILIVLYMNLARSKRIARFASQLPDSLDIIVRGLRIGHPFSKAVELVAHEMPDPIGSEFGMTADEMTFGQDVTTAVDNLYRRVGQEDLLFLVIAISVQTQTGGNLAEVLSRLSRLMRERVKLRLKVKALSAEGRMSAWFLTAMPFILFGAVQLLSPKYFEELRGSAALAPALIYGLGSLLIANYAIYRMVHFKV